VELPTYTSIWRIEKRLYKLYDFRLPMPLPVGQIAVFTAITVPYVILLTLFGLPFSHTLFWLYVLPPGVLTWLATRPVLESKRLPELIISQVRYVGEPSAWCRMTPHAEKDEMIVTGRVWRRGRTRPAVEPQAVPDVPAVPAVEPVAVPAVARPGERARPRPVPAAAPGQADGRVRVPAAGGVPGAGQPQGVRATAAPVGPGGTNGHGSVLAAFGASGHSTPPAPAPARAPAPAGSPVPAGSPAPAVAAAASPAAPAPASAPANAGPPAAAAPAGSPAAGGPQAPAPAGPPAAAAHAPAAPPPPARETPAAGSTRAPGPPPVVVVPVQRGPAGPPTVRPRTVERALSGPAGQRSTNWRDRVVLVPGGVGPGRPDHDKRDRARAVLPVDGARLVAVLGCTVGAGQTVTTLMVADLLASLRGEAVAALDLNPAPGSLAELAAPRPVLAISSLLAGADGPAGPAPGRRQANGHKPGGRGQLDVFTPEVRGDGAVDMGDLEYRRVFDAVAGSYGLTLADPGAAAVARVLAVADQLVLVAPASPDAARALAMTQEWLGAHGYEALAMNSITVVNGLSKRSMPHAEQAELVVRGRCRAIVRVPWDDHLAEPQAERGIRDSLEPDAAASRLGQLRPPVLQAYTALAGVLVAALAASSQRRRVAR
jgi:MinD-like ATPase involved in chromosome partitioning or flagellar assembly